MFFTIVFTILVLASLFPICILAYFSKEVNNEERKKLIGQAVGISLGTIFLTDISSLWTLKPNEAGLEIAFASYKRVVVGPGYFFSNPFSEVYKGEISPDNLELSFSVVTTDGTSFIVKGQAVGLVNSTRLPDYVESGIFYLDDFKMKARAVYHQTLISAVTSSLVKVMTTKTAATVTQVNGNEILPEAQKTLDETLNSLLVKTTFGNGSPEKLVSLKITSIIEQPSFVLEK